MENQLENPNMTTGIQPFDTHTSNTGLQIRMENTSANENNETQIKEMKEEIALWIVFVIAYFVTGLVFYISIQFPLPIEALFSIPIILDIGMIIYFYQKTNKFQ